MKRWILFVLLLVMCTVTSCGISPIHAEVTETRMEYDIREAMCSPIVTSHGVHWVYSIQLRELDGYLELLEGAVSFTLGFVYYFWEPCIRIDSFRITKG